MIMIRNLAFWLLVSVITILPLAVLAYLVQFRLFMIFPLGWFSGLFYWGIKIPNTAKYRGKSTEFELIKNTSPNDKHPAG